MALELDSATPADIEELATVHLEAMANDTLMQNIFKHASDADRQQRNIRRFSAALERGDQVFKMVDTGNGYCDLPTTAF